MGLVHEGKPLNVSPGEAEAQVVRFVTWVAVCTHFVLCLHLLDSDNFRQTDERGQRGVDHGTCSWYQ